MELDKIKEIRKLVGIQIALSLNEVGTRQLNFLVNIQSNLDKLIKYLDDPIKQEIKYKKLERLINGK